MTFDLVIRGGTVVDGTGKDGYSADIGVNGGVISAIGDLAAAETACELDARGLIVAPGFIDAHTHSDLACYQDAALSAASVRQGVTTEVCGNCGFSPFPCPPERTDDVRRHVDVLLGPRAFPELSAWGVAVEAEGLYANLLPLVGHGTLRAGVLGFVRRAPRSDEFRQMAALARGALEQGAAGVSSGLVYTPGAYAQTAEIVDLCRQVLAGTGRPYVTHIRGETHMVREAVSEAIAIGRDAGVPVHISHHKVAGRENWGRSDETLALVAQARAEGTDVTIDVYPYTAASTLLYSLLPPWVQEGGRGPLLERLADRDLRERLTLEIEQGHPGWEDFPRAAGWDGVVVASSPMATECEGRSIADLADEASLPPLDYVAGFLRATDGQVIVLLHVMAESDVRNILAFDGAMVGSDGLPLPGKPHPRVAGTFSRVLRRYSREEKLLALPEAVRKMTALTAERFGLVDRGIIALDKAADLVIFSAEEVGDRADFAEPLRPPEGTWHVLVDGNLVVAHGKLTGLRPGRVLAGQA